VLLRSPAAFPDASKTSKRITEYSGAVPSQLLHRIQTAKLCDPGKISKLFATNQTAHNSSQFKRKYDIPWIEMPFLP